MNAEPFIHWQSDTITHCLCATNPPGQSIDAGKLSYQVDAALKEINRAVRGNRHGTMSRDDFRALYEATLLWCLRKCGRPEVANA